MHKSLLIYCTWREHNVGSKRHTYTHTNINMCTSLRPKFFKLSFSVQMCQHATSCSTGLSSVYNMTHTLHVDMHRWRGGGEATHKYSTYILYIRSNKETMTLTPKNLHTQVPEHILKLLAIMKCYKSMLLRCFGAPCKLWRKYIFPSVSDGHLQYLHCPERIVGR